MKTFSIKESIRGGWEIWKGNKMVLTLMTLLMFFVGMLPNPGGNGVVLVVIAIILDLLSIFIGMGYIKSLLLIERGEKVEFREIFRHARYFWRYLIVSILYGLLVGLGLILLIVPGIYFALKYSFAPILVLDKDTKIMEAFSQSGMLTVGVKWKLLGFYIVAALVSLLGFLALGVGALIATPVVGLAAIHVYKKLLNVEVVPPIAPIAQTVPVGL